MQRCAGCVTLWDHRLSGEIKGMFGDDQYKDGGRENDIAVHVCRKDSGRISRTADAKNLDAEIVGLPVIAHIIHMETK